MSKLTGRLTNKDGFITSTTMQKVVKLEIDGVSYNYFLNNNADRKAGIKDLSINDMIEYEIKEDKGFKFVDEVRKVEIETKENSISTDSTPNPYPTNTFKPQATPPIETAVETEDMKWNRINKEKREAIIKGQCLNIASTKKDKPKEIVDYAMQLLEEIRRQKYQDF